MPIPTGGAWPPPEHAPAYSAYRDWDAWYVGNPAKLRAVYGHRDSHGHSLPPSQRARAAQYAGGILGTLSRWLWGNPPTPGQRDGRLHVPLPADLASTAANLIFSEPPALDADDKQVQARLEQLEEDGLQALLLHAAEANSAFGDVYLRPVRDPDVYPDRAFLSTVHADAAIPTIRWGKLIEVTFWTTLVSDRDRHVRALEHHEVVNGAGRIVHAVYEGTATELGRPVPLTEYSGTAYLADLIDAEGAEPTGLDRLDVVRVPNAGPQRSWRTVPGLRYHGRSDFDGSEQLFDSIDDVWTSWLRDVRLARGRVIVPEYMLRSNGAGQGATFDAEREVYSTIQALPDQNVSITPQQFEIRWEAHKATAEAVVAQALRHAGLSSQTLGEEGNAAAAVTATEVQARERASFTTRGNRIEGAWKPGIADAVELLLEYERVWFKGGPDPVRPKVEFPDGVQEGPETTARTLQLLFAAEAVSIETRVRMVNPDWDDTQVREEVDRIRQDAGGGQDPAVTLGGLAGNKTDPAAGPPDQQGKPEE